MSAISIIIPVYNAEKYLPKCLNSILHQTFEDIEIICVNDGSTDGSFGILEKYSKKDSRIVVINKPNGGVVSARKAGMDIARGLYTGFVDSDDWIEPDMYESLYHLAIKYNVDLVSSGYYTEGNYTTETIDSTDLDYYDKENIQQLRDSHLIDLKKRRRTMGGSLWSKLFRTELLKKVHNNLPEKLVLGEDRACLLAFMLEAQSVYIVRKAYYHWVQNNESMSHQNRPDNGFLTKIDYLYQYIASLYSHPSFSKRMQDAVEIYMVSVIFNGINKRMGFKNENLLRIDPYWLDIIPQNSKIITYGGGDLLEQYKRQLRSRRDIVHVKELGFSEPSSILLEDVDYDYILITIKNEDKANSVKEQFLMLNIPEEKILWFPQPEFYWKYVEAEGLME